MSLTDREGAYRKGQNTLYHGFGHMKRDAQYILTSAVLMLAKTG
jgi:hypothetical protein